MCCPICSFLHHDAWVRKPQGTWGSRWCAWPSINLPHFWQKVFSLQRRYCLHNIFLVWCSPACFILESDANKPMCRPGRTKPVSNEEEIAARWQSVWCGGWPGKLPPNTPLISLLWNAFQWAGKLWSQIITPWCCLCSTYPQVMGRAIHTRGSRLRPSFLQMLMTGLYIYIYKTSHRI